MATVKNTITMQDKMTPVLRTIIKSLDSTITAMASVDKMSNTAFNKARKDIIQAYEALDKFNNEAEETAVAGNKATSAFTRMKNPLVSIASLIYTIKTAVQGLSSVAGGIDNSILTGARLDLINDGLQTTADLQNKIMQSANRSKSAYEGTAAAISKMGLLASDAFTSNDEIIAFTELLNKAFKIGGSSTQEQQSALYQLTQAMAAGKLQGDEFRSIMENAPMVAQAIADYTKVSKGKLKELSKDGVITANVIKNALFNSADQINKKFEQMPTTFGTITDRIKNEFLKRFQPIIDRVKQFLNNPNYETFINNVNKGLNVMAHIASGAMDAIEGIYNFIKDNWGLLGPIIGTVTAAWLAYKVATTIAAAGQWALNAAMTANPIGLIVAAIAILIAAIIMLWDKCEGFRKWVAEFWADNMIWSAKGINFSIDVYNKWVEAQNYVLDNFIKIDSTIREFWISVVKTAGEGAKGFVEQFDFIAEKVSSFIPIYNKLADVFKWDKVQTDAFTTDDITNAIDRKISDYEAALRSAGGSLEDTLNSWKADYLKKIDMEKYAKNVKNYSDKIKDFTFGGLAEEIINGLTSNLPGVEDYPTIPDEIVISGGNLDFIGEIKDDVSITDEDLKYLKDVAKTEFVNKYTTLRPELKVSFGDVHETADINGILDAMEDMIEEAYASSLVTG